MFIPIILDPPSFTIVRHVGLGTLYVAHFSRIGWFFPLSSNLSGMALSHSRAGRTLILTTQLIMIADLRSDYVNPVEFTQKINFLWLPEIIGVGFVTLVSLIFGTWWIFLLHVPLCGYLGYM